MIWELFKASHRGNWCTESRGLPCSWWQMAKLWFQDLNDKYLTSCLFPLQDRDTGTPESSTRFPSWCNPPDPFPSACPHYGPNAHPHAHTEPAAHTAAGVQGTSVSPVFWFSVNYFNFNLTFFVDVDAAGAIAAAAANPAAPKWHGALGSTSFRRRSQHSAPRSAPEEAPRALAACCQPGEGLDFFNLVDLLAVCWTNHDE